MTDDLRTRLAEALDLHVSDPTGAGRLWVHGTLDGVLDSLVKALGEPETQWGTECSGHLYANQENVARYRARNPDHTLMCRQVVILRDWHQPDDKEN